MTPTIANGIYGHYHAIHFGIYNRDLIEAVVAKIPNALENYFRSNQIYMFDIAEDGEFIAWTLPQYDEDQIRSLISRRVIKIVEKWKKAGKEFFAPTAASNPQLPRSSYRFPLYHNMETTIAFIARGILGIAVDIAPKFEFNQFFTGFDYKIPVQMMECFGYSLKKGMDSKKLISKFGTEMVEEMTGTPRNVIEQMNRKAFAEKFYQLIDGLEKEMKTTLEKSRAIYRKNNAVHSETWEERKVRLENLDKEQAELKANTFEKVKKLRQKFGV